MNFHPRRDRVSELCVSAAVMVPAEVKHPDVARRVRNPDPEAECVLSLRVARCRCTGVCRSSFTNKRFKKQYVTINVSELMRMEEGSEVTLKTLEEAGGSKVSAACDGLKILGKGELSKKLDVKAKVFTASAKEN